MVTINIYDNAAKQSDNAVQSAEAGPMPQASSLIQETLTSFAPQPESMQVNAEAAFADKVPSPDLLSGMPLTESDAYISEQTFLENFTSSSTPSPTKQIDVSTVDASAPAPTAQTVNANIDQADAPVPSLEPGETAGEKGSKDEQNKKK